ncbi:hypothetical protein LPB03_12335 [Polaribacter vadi]|uniref:DUF5017 domain-containing protein n=1 Tax=Polaribacter vadi TaxID=1774273 RepID=A0A1B8TTD3_9FLAO|nr:choice-of-anchor J domain-containing protein [Polaribacter vadi]AOW18191.1 hypothetical protein LPB03_12335 [Polaribacter vadi]OBY62923.1 hypothetical protein LPB3_12350 [Polaribacter vadi]
MKKILLLLTVFSMVFTSCDPLEDIYEEVEARDISGEVTYTLTDDDYESLGFESRYFNSEDEAKSLLPSFLSNKYPLWGNGSTASISYKLEMLGDYTGAVEYSLALTDYPSNVTDNAIAFYDSENANDFLPTILEANFTTAVEGDVVLAKYNQYVGETENGITEFYTADFAGEGTLLGYEAVSVSGDQVWEGTNYGAKMTGFASGNRNPNEDWLISSDIDLSSFPNATLETTQIFNYGDPSGFSVLISTDYTDDISAATWDVIDLTNVPDGTSWDEVLSNPYSLAAYNGKTINIAFKYTSTSTDAGTYEVVNVSLKAAGVEGETEGVSEFYTFDGSAWELSEGVYYLSDADFDSMGESSGQPGRYNNFSSSITPNDYLPTFLKNKFPYAQEGDVFSLVYRYYDGGALLKGNTYSYSNGVWGDFNYTIDFSHDGSKWAPATKYELVAEDYTLIANTFRTVEGYEAAVANLESYGNISTFSWEEEQIDAAINTVLKTRFPDAAEGQNFDVIVYVYNGSSQNITINYTLSSGVYIRR